MFANAYYRHQSGDIPDIDITRINKLNISAKLSNVELMSLL